MGIWNYIGRMDDQVKVRGYRIEVGEVESALRAVRGVSAAVVVARADASGGKQLTGYWVGAATESRLREELSRRLPAYMVPAHLMLLDSLPLTANGKVNRKALPELEATSGSAYVAPRDEMEAELCALFAEVLGVDRVGIEDDFFALGGHSLKAIEMVAQLRKVLKVVVSLLELVAQPTVKELAAVIVQTKELASVRADPDSGA